MNQDGNPLLDGIKSEQKSSSTPTTPLINTPIKKEMIKVEQPQELKAKIEELQRQRAKDGEVSRIENQIGVELGIKLEVKQFKQAFNARAPIVARF